MNQIRVDMDETIIRPANFNNLPIILTTNGVSTCLCLCVRGHANGKEYIGMQHWPGFDQGFNNHTTDIRERARDAIEYLIEALADDIATEMDCPYGEKPSLSAFYTIGGEHSADSLSGTELEVETLKEYIQTFCDKYFVTTDKTAYFEDTYRTTGTHDLAIRFGAKHIQITEDEAEVDEDDNRLSYSITL